MIFSTILLLLILAHLVGDFALQTNWVFKLKNQSVYGIALHVGIHAVATITLLNGWTKIAVWSYVFMIAATHFACDWYKQRHYPEGNLSTFILDQAAHVVVLLLVAFLLPKSLTVPPSWVLYPFFAAGVLSAHKIAKIVLDSQVEPIAIRHYIPATPTNYLDEATN